MNAIRPELKVALKQVLTPQLYQLLKLLQMPYLELEQTVRNELEMNPLLEEQQESTEEENSQPQQEQETKKEFKEIDWTDFFQGDYDYSYKPKQYINSAIPEKVAVVKPSIRDHLLGQLHLNVMSDEISTIGEYIIDSLDESGFLDTDVQEIMEALNTSESNVLEALKLVQTFDPSGIASRNIEECLTIQLYQNGYTETSVEVNIVQNFLKEIGEQKFDKIKRKIGVSEIKIREAVVVISSLNPKPLRGFGDKGIRYIIPDLILKDLDDGYEVIINEATLPSLRINSYYREILEQKNNLLKEEKEFIKQRLNSAVNLMKGLEERRHSILKVTNYIVEKQKAFFEEGVSKLVPLTMQRVSEAIGLHESTISRIVQGKYIDTSRGLLELKFFFSGSVTTSNNGDISVRSVREKIRTMVENEEKKHPFKDKEIAEKLETDGIKIARRTIAKYRKQLGILPARLRKEG